MKDITMFRIWQLSLCALMLWGCGLLATETTSTRFDSPTTIPDQLSQSSMTSTPVRHRATVNITSTATPTIKPISTPNPSPQNTPTSISTAHSDVFPELYDLVLSRDELVTAEITQSETDFREATLWIKDDTDLLEDYCPVKCLRRQFVSSVRALTIVLAIADNNAEAEDIVTTIRNDYEPPHFDYAEWLRPEIHSPSQATWIMIDANGKFSMATSYGQVILLVRLTPYPGSDDGGGQAITLVEFANLQIAKLKDLGVSP